jgi:hypothetical protein
LHDAGTHQPFLGDEDDDELLGDQGQTKHQGESDEGGKRMKRLELRTKIKGKKSLA